MCATQTTPNLEKSSRLSWLNVSIILSLGLGSICYGYDFSIITFTVGQPAWYAYFNLTTDPAKSDLFSYTNNIIGAIFGLFSAGAILGAIFTGWYCDVHGRKKALVVGAYINILGGALQAGSVHIAMFILARFITGFAAAIFVTLVPIYIAEIAPPATRGLLVGQHGAFFLIGYSLASWVSVGAFFNKETAQFQWRFPLALQSLWPLLVLVFVQAIPESPRWLISRGNTADAWNVLCRLHTTVKGEEHGETLAKQEFDHIRSQIAMDHAVYGHVSTLDLFCKPHFAKRMLCSAIVMFTSQACGNLVIYSNAAILFRGLGFNDSLSLVLSAVYITWACVCNFANATFLDKLGRVRSMLYGSTTNRGGLAAGVIILFCYITTFAGFCDTTLYVYCSEIFPTHIRAKGMAWSISIFMLSTIPFLESSTIGFSNLGWKYYLIFIVFAVVCTIVMWIYCPETKGLSLEEINRLFGDEVAFPPGVTEGVGVSVEKTDEESDDRGMADKLKIVEAAA
ncbi:hypothetical protein BHE90_002253 [Fusarium euwallaceae]|uniref:Major facilitator superfamily (MFS) profile domain-containing protein n=2 Tax=Fusarium solani species complex TaxID=232080 RepID=A0A430M5J0_9HYPO|nr:hypothetical protein CEP51_004586 [Fusarium floridanum]RTE83182.1 hypothetical protein BHE90_002253 [Fusarium euwallaceae]